MHLVDEVFRLVKVVQPMQYAKGYIGEEFNEAVLVR
jgi:hypothetical protein